MCVQDNTILLLYYLFNILTEPNIDFLLLVQYMCARASLLLRRSRITQTMYVFSITQHKFRISLKTTPIILIFENCNNMKRRDDILYSHLLSNFTCIPRHFNSFPKHIILLRRLHKKKICRTFYNDQKL